MFGSQKKNCAPRSLLPVRPELGEHVLFLNRSLGFPERDEQDPVMPVPAV